MPTLQSPGIGSGLDVKSLVQQLVQADRQPTDLRLNREQARANSTLSALGKLRSALSSLSDAVTSLTTAGTLQPRKATVVDSGYYTATVTSGAAPGNYAVQVSQLAKAEKLTSVSLGAVGAPVGSGDLTLDLGGNSFTVSFSSAATVTDIAAAINAAPDNTGIHAAVVTGNDGQHLVLSADKTGTANTITVSQANGDGGLAAIAYDSSAGQTSNYTETTAAQDAIVNIDGVTYNTASNTVDGMLAGTTLTLTKADPGVTHTLTVTQDSAALKATLQKFVDSYNSLVKVINTQTSYDATNKTAAALNGDAMTRGIASRIRSVLSTTVSAAGSVYDTLASVGITTKSDGQLTIDQTKLDSALSQNFDAVGRLFGGTNGVATLLKDVLTPYIQSNGLFDDREAALKSRLDSVTQQRDDLDARMAQVQQAYMQQFTALDTLMSQMQSTSNFLMQQLGSGSTQSTGGGANSLSQGG